jgi:hypothetical protein
VSHPRKPTDLGTNRTGIAASPVDAKKTVEGAARAVPAAGTDPAAFRKVHEELAEQAPPVGTMPPPATLKGAAKMAVQAIKGDRGTVFLDKLAERLAFERGGVRLYDALIVKFGAAEPHDTGVSLEDLEEIRDDELRHMGVVMRAIQKLGGDPTVMTPCADVIGVASTGLVQVLTDPRTTFTQGLDAILVAELADNDGWDLLVGLAEGLGLTDLVTELRVALDEEADHLRKVRAWIQRAVTGQAGARTAATPPPPTP